MCDNKMLAENRLPLMDPHYIKVAIESKNQNYSEAIKKSHPLVNISLFTLSLMTFIIFWFTNAYNRILLEKIILREGSEMFSFYTSPPIDPILKVWMFNYTNIDDFINGSAKKIKLDEIGPYVYRERIEKTGIEIEGQLITFRENRSHTFLHASSNGLNEDDIIIAPNMVLISAFPNVKSMGYFASLGFKTILASTNPKEFQNVTVGNYVHGYSDNFKSLIEKFKWDFKAEDVGILAVRRGVDLKTITVYSGTGDVQKVGQVHAVGDQTKLNIWKSDKCNQVSGSDGVINGPSLVQNKQEFAIYLTNSCRTLPLVFDREEKIMNGMRTFRYKAPTGVFSSLESTPDNKYYCEQKSLTEKHIDGVMDISDCLEGHPPIVFSHPHFMEGDDELFKHFEGLKPNKSLHDSFMYVHPRLSVPMHGVSRMMLSLRLTHFGKYYKNLPEGIVLPLAWIETTTEEFSEHIKTRLWQSTVLVDFIEQFIKFGSLASLMLTSAYVIVCQTCGVESIKRFMLKMLQVSRTTSH